MVLITDTKSVWTEGESFCLQGNWMKLIDPVLDGKQFARRWRFLNSNSPAPYDDQGDEDAWRESSLELVSNAHTLGAISEMPFEVVDSNFSVSSDGFRCSPLDSDVRNSELCFPYRTSHLS
jgi:hypothetical protein